MTQKIFLQGYQGKNSSNTSEGVNVSLKGKHKFLPFNDAAHTISQYEQYLDERDSCNKIRLTCQINTICSNVLFNRVSEITKDEGGSNVSIINYGIGNDIEAVESKPMGINYWSSSTINYISRDSSIDNLPIETSLSQAIKQNQYGDFEILSSNSLHPTNAIRDTQLSSLDNGYIYHCGLDIFNNHLIRSNTFKTVCNLPSSVATDNMNTCYTAFNTICDVMRDVQGDKVVEKIYFPIDANVDGNAKIVALHLYEYDDILSFDESIQQKLISKYDGWVGLNNTSKIKTYKNFSLDEEFEIERPIQYMNGGDFVDMYPNRELFSFVPKYNNLRKRIEKNWNYCITYPSKSYCPQSNDEPFSDIIDTVSNGLKVIYYDENTRADNGTKQLVLYSIAKHGLKQGDFVNIYCTFEGSSQMLIQEAEVTNVVDDYIFTVFNSSIQISSKWISITDEERHSGYNLTIDGVKYTIDDTLAFFTTDNMQEKFYIINNSYVNFDKSRLHLSYKKTVGGIECDYYIRIFSKLPNFKFASANTYNEYELYKDDCKTIKTYQDKKYDFSSQVSRLAFAKNIYTDDIGEIVFTDDIDISSLHDNLNRPLSTLYLTIIKNNHGYKEWYGFGYGEEWQQSIRDYISKEEVEYSHCFGKISCGIPTCDESIYENSIYSINRICNISDNATTIPFGGYDVSFINASNRINLNNVDDDEIWYDCDTNFYGDLCYYDGYNAMEYHVDYIYNRFTSAQRESVNSQSADYFEGFNYDEITHDDYDISSPYTITVYNSKDKINCNRLKEGYYYCPHYEIPIKEFGNLQTIMPDFLSVRQIKLLDANLCKYMISCRQQHYLSVGDKSMIYDRQQDKYYILETVTSEYDNSYVFTCIAYDEKSLNKTLITYTDLSGNTINIENVTTSSENSPLTSYKLFKVDNLNVPSYAHLLKDGTCRYIWRDIINNGINGESSQIEVYPFTNGAFYVNRNVNLYVRRQDPHDMYGLYDSVDIIGNDISSTSEDNYIQEQDILC